MKPWASACTMKAPRPNSARVTPSISPKSHAGKPGARIHHDVGSAHGAADPPVGLDRYGRSRRREQPRWPRRSSHRPPPAEGETRYPAGIDGTPGGPRGPDGRLHRSDIGTGCRHRTGSLRRRDLLYGVANRCSRRCVGRRVRCPTPGPTSRRENGGAPLRASFGDLRTTPETGVPAGQVGLRDRAQAGVPRLVHCPSHRTLQVPRRTGRPRSIREAVPHVRRWASHRLQADCERGPGRLSGGDPREAGPLGTCLASGRSGPSAYPRGAGRAALRGGRSRLPRTAGCRSRC